MKIKELVERVNNMSESSSGWLELHKHIVQHHKNAETEEEHEALLALHERLMDKIETHHSEHIDLEAFQKIRLQEYNKFLLRECQVGGSFCVDTLYALTQRELEAGRMLPSHEFINISIEATASDHYSREQLDRQREKIQKIERNTALSKISRLFKE
jgi:hypothetical protein